MFVCLAADCERLLGPDHPYTLISRTGRARFTGQAGNPAAALGQFTALAADTA